MIPAQHVDDRLDDWLDGRLDAAERAAVERHLRACEECRNLRDGLVATRRVLRDLDASAETPAGLEGRILQALDREDRERGDERTPEGVVAFPSRESSRRAAPTRHRPTRDRRARDRRAQWRDWVVAAAAVLAVAVGLSLWLRLEPGLTSPPSISPPPSPSQTPFSQTPFTQTGPLARVIDGAFAQYATLESGGGFDAGTDVPTGDPLATVSPAGVAELQSRWQAAALGFEARVLDLRAMGIELAAGGTPSLDGRPAALAVYASSGDDGAPIACWMFRGVEADLPEPAAEHRERGFVFHVYEREDVTLVVWREGDVLCALARRGPRADVLALAVGKAMIPVA